MTGTILNAAGIVIGAMVGLLRKTPLSRTNEVFFRRALGVFTVFFGLQLTWRSVNGSALQCLGQLGIVLLSLVLGRLAGKLLQLQKTSNRLGQFAVKRIAAATPDNPNRFSDGFNACAVLFCAAPLGILGAICDGLVVHGMDTDYFYPLAVKAVMDGLAAMSFVAIFGWSVLLSAIPVLVFQGSITLLTTRFIQPFLHAHSLVDPLNATAGLLIFCVALVIFEIRRIELTDYLPSLAFAPLLAHWLIK